MKDFPTAFTDNIQIFKIPIFVFYSLTEGLGKPAQVDPDSAHESDSII
jgi:hypothetical protein